MIRVANEIKWIKITTDIFDNVKVKAIKAIPEVGHTLVCMWFELLCMAGSCNNNGLLVMTNKVAFNDELLATVFNEDIRMVRMALDAFQKWNMIEIAEDNSIQITNWLEYQSGAKLEEIKQRHAQSQREYRERQKLLQAKESDITRDITSDVTSSISISNNTNNNLSDIKEIIDYLNIRCNKHYTLKNKTNISHIKARLSEGFTVDDFKTVIDKKADAWLNDAKMCNYLRPETLFSGKFESYLNERSAKPNGNVKYDARDVYGEDFYERYEGRIDDVLPL